MLLFRVALVLFAIGLWLYCVYDVIRSDDTRVRNLPKLVWLVFVVLVPTLGSVAWLLLGRVPSGKPLFVERRRPRAPDDSPEFLEKLDDEIRRRRQREELDRRRGTPDLPTDIDAEIDRFEQEFGDDEPDASP